MSPPRSIPGPVVYLVDQDARAMRILGRDLEAHGYRVVRALGLADVEQALAGGPLPRFAIVETRLEGREGHEVLRRLAAAAPNARVVVLTNHATLAGAVAAVRLGAVDYLARPADFRRIERSLWVDPSADDVRFPDRGPTLDEHEQEYIEYVLQRCEGNITQAAAWLGIYRQSLQRKLKRMGRRA